MTNETLLIFRSALLGDRNAFGQLVEAYQSPVRRFFYHLTNGDEEQSKDLAQETFIKAWLHITSFRATAAFSTWLYRIACNVFYDHCRVRKETVGIEGLSITEIVEDKALNTDFEMDFVQALSTLNVNERTAMLLFYMEDKSVNKIAIIMGCPTGTVKSHLYRGKEKLATYLKNTEYDNER